MAAVTELTGTELAQAAVAGEAQLSPAGPVQPATPIKMPPEISAPRLVQALRFGVRPLGFNLRAHRELGDVWQMQVLSRRLRFVVTAHPEHVRSLMTAPAEDAPSLTGESPLRPILGPNSVLTLVGDRHMRQRKLLLPAFHGEAVQRYVSMISELTEREIDSWPVHRPFVLVSRMQTLTLDVIMRGIFGVEGTPAPGTVEYRMRETLQRLLNLSRTPVWQLVELQNLGRDEPRGFLRAVVKLVDRTLYAAIRERRVAGAGGRRDDVLSLLLDARDEDGQPLSDPELRDQLLSLVLAGHETTANSLAWTVDRLLRTPDAYDRLREVTRTQNADDGDAYVDATIHEGMRVRPVIPMIVRMVMRPWRFGDYVVPARTPVAVSIVALHHRADVYPEPMRFSPERFLDRKPGTYTWIPFGGGIRRCLGATLAMAEQRVVLGAIARRVDLVAADPGGERPLQRNVTMIPRRGTRVVVESKRPA
jgi:cytochrome P450